MIVGGSKANVQSKCMHVCVRFSLNRNFVVVLCQQLGEKEDEEEEKKDKRNTNEKKKTENHHQMIISSLSTI
jgi:hypothetical protein